MWEYGGPLVGLYEFTYIHEAILNNIHSGRAKKYQVLHKALISKLNSKAITIGIFSMLHISILTLTTEYIALALITIFVSIIYIKIYSFN